jgi:hypothetical protein
VIPNSIWVRKMSSPNFPTLNERQLKVRFTANLKDLLVNRLRKVFVIMLYNAGHVARFETFHCLLLIYFHLFHEDETFTFLIFVTGPKGIQQHTNI